MNKGLFVGYGEDARFAIRILTVIVAVESLVIMALGLFAFREPIVYVNPSNVIGSAYVGYVPEEAVSYFALSFISSLGNVNQYSVKEQYQTAFLLMSPKLASAMKRTLETEMGEIQKSDMSIQTTPIEVKVTGDGDIFTVEMEATRMSYVYGQETKREKLRYTLHCQKATTRKWNPFGLEMTSYDNEILAKGAAVMAAGERPLTAPAGSQAKQ